MQPWQMEWLGHRRIVQQQLRGHPKLTSNDLLSQTNNVFCTDYHTSGAPEAAEPLDLPDELQLIEQQLSQLRAVMDDDFGRIHD